MNNIWYTDKSQPGFYESSKINIFYQKCLLKNCDKIFMSVEGMYDHAQMEHGIPVRKKNVYYVRKQNGKYQKILKEDGEKDEDGIMKTCPFKVEMVINRVKTEVFCGEVFSGNQGVS